MSIESLRLVRNIGLFLAIYFSVTFILVICLLPWIINECNVDPECKLSTGINDAFFVYFVMSTPSAFFATFFTLCFQAEDPKNNPKTCHACNQVIRN